MQNELTVCVTGAAGMIGYAFIPLLCTGQVFGPNTKINLNLLDIPQMEKVCLANAMEISDCAYPLVKSVRYGSDPMKMFEKIDVGVFIGGFPRKQGMERKELLTINGNIFKAQGKALEAVASKNVKILVVANPANTNCLILQKNAPSIPKENFTAMTRLDHNRALSQLAEKAGCHSTDVKNIAIWGNHSSTQYPCVYHGTIKGKKVTEVITDEKYLKEEFIAKVQKRGAEIIAVKGTSSVFSAANAAKDHLRDWFLGNTHETLSMAIYTDGQYYGVGKDLIYSFPVRCLGNWKVEVVTGLDICECSKQKLIATEKELNEEKSEAMN